MRINKRLVENAPKRDPNELAVELIRIEQIKHNPEYNMRLVARLWKKAVSSIHSSTIKFGAHVCTLNPYVNTINIVIEPTE